MTAIKLIVGLGNPGPEYADTRHNAGAWFVANLANLAQQTLRYDAKFHAQTGHIRYLGYECRLLIPTTYMNRSGQSVQAIARFYRLQPEEILVAHDELDLPTGMTRLKQNGGHGGHNGLRDIIAQLNSAQFLRLRLGIGRPAHSSQVSDYVLKRPSRAEQSQIEAAIADSATVLPLLLAGNIAQAMQQLHTTPTPSTK